MSLMRIFTGIVVVSFVLLVTQLPAYAQSPGVNAVRLDIMNLKDAAPFMVNGKSFRGSLLDVLRLGQPKAGTILNVFFHSNETRIKDVEEVLATADKQGDFAEKHMFIPCYVVRTHSWKAYCRSQLITQTGIVGGKSRYRTLWIINRHCCSQAQPFSID